MELALGGVREELGGEARENAEVTERVLGERGDELRCHQGGIAGSGEKVDERLLKLGGWKRLEREPGADPARKREKLVASELVEEPGIAGEDDGEKLAGVEVGAEKEPELVEYGGVHLLGLVDEQYGPKEGGLEVGLPAFVEATWHRPNGCGVEEERRRRHRARGKSRRGSLEAWRGCL